MGPFRPFLLRYENSLLSVLKRKEKDDLICMGPLHPTRSLMNYTPGPARPEGSPGNRFRARVKYGTVQKYDIRKSWHFLCLNCANISGYSYNRQVLPYYNTAHYNPRVETESRVSRYDRPTPNPSSPFHKRLFQHSRIRPCLARHKSGLFRPLQCFCCK